MKITPRRARWIGRVGAPLLRALAWTLRTDGTPTTRSDAIYAIPHGRLLIAAMLHRSQRIAVLISTHGDGELIAQTVDRLGFRSVRGSSTRGGARAVLEMHRHCGDRPWAITPDGPRGPAFSVAPGVLALAARSGRPIVPVGYAARRAKYLKSWDQFAIPWPFTKVAVRFGEPIRVGKQLEPVDEERLLSNLRRALVECNEEAERGVGASSRRTRLDSA